VFEIFLPRRKDMIASFCAKTPRGGKFETFAKELSVNDFPPGAARVMENSWNCFSRRIADLG
jgi:hypothetical protein